MVGPGQILNRNDPRYPKVFELGRQADGSTLGVDHSYKFSSDVEGTFNLSSKSMLIEILGDKHEVRIDSKAVHHIAHLRMGQLLEIGLRRFVLLEHLSCHLNQGALRASREQKNLQASIYGVVEPSHLSTNSSSSGPIPARQKQQIRLVLGVQIFFVLTLATLLFWVKEVKPAHPAQEVSALPPIPVEEILSVSKGRNKKILLVDKQESEIQEDSSEAPPVLAAKNAARPSLPPIAPALIRQIKAKIPKIKLEGRFDPSLARQKLSHLERKLPDGHPLRLEIELTREQMQ